MLGNPVAIMHKYLSAQAPLMALATGGLYSPRIPGGESPPAIAFFVRGGSSNPNIPPLPTVSFQFDCWANSDDTPAEDAYEIYLELYDAIQGIQNKIVTVGGTPYKIKSVIEEVSGQQIQPVAPETYHRTMGLFQVMMEV